MKTNMKLKTEIRSRNSKRIRNSPKSGCLDCTRASSPCGGVRTNIPELVSELTHVSTRRLLSCTNKDTEAEEFQGLQGALASVGSVATAMNQAKREAEQRENLRRIEAALAAQGVVCGGKCLKQGLVCLVKSGSSSSSLDVGVGKEGGGSKGLWGLVGGGSKGGGDGGEERWAYLFDDGLVCSEGTRNAAEQAGFFSPDKGLGGGSRWGQMTSVKEVEGGEGGKEFVIEYGERAELMRGANASVAGEWVAELRRTRLRVAVSEQVEAGRSLEQVFNDFDRDNDGGLDRYIMNPKH
jgi:hypothetical protein